MNNQAKVIISAEDRSAAAFASVMRNVDKLGLNFDTLKAGAVGALAALSVPVSLAGLTQVFNTSRNAIDGLNDLADASGSSVEAISALDNIARSTGGNLETVSSILVKFNGVLAEAKPDKGVGATLKAIGLSLEELRRLDPAEALRVTAVAVEQLGSEADKARVYQELFGKSVRDAAPFLKDLAEAKRLDATLTKDQIEQVDKFNKELAKIEATAANVGRSLTITVAGALNTVIDRFREGQKEGKSFWQIALEGYRKDMADLTGIGAPPPIAPGRVSSGPIIDPTDPRAVLRRMEREQDTRPRASILPPPAPNGGGGTRSAALTEAEKAQRDYDAFIKKAEEDRQAYLFRRAEKALQEEEALQKRYQDDLAQFEEDRQNYVYQRNLKRIEDEEKAREDAAKRATQALEDQQRRLGDAFASTFGRAFDEGMKLGDLIKRLAFDAINIQFLTPAAQKAGNWLGSAVSSLFSFDGGGYTGAGSRSGGMDGKGGFLAMLHPNETVVDHTRGQGMGGGGVVINYSIDARGADAGVEQRLRAALAESEARLRSAIVPTMLGAVKGSTGVARAMRGG